MSTTTPVGSGAARRRKNRFIAAAQIGSEPPAPSPVPATTPPAPYSPFSQTAAGDEIASPRRRPVVAVEVALPLPSSFGVSSSRLKQLRHEHEHLHDITADIDDADANATTSQARRHIRINKTKPQTFMRY
jgi:hypothetical protein